MWTNEKAEKPKSGKNVLLRCESNYNKDYKYMCAGHYIAQYSVKVPGDDVETEQEQEYDSGPWYLKEGYYENQYNWGEYSSIYISDKVTHWDELPDDPEK